MNSSPDFHQPHAFPGVTNWAELLMELEDDPPGCGLPDPARVARIPGYVGSILKPEFLTNDMLFGLRAPASQEARPVKPVRGRRLRVPASDSLSSAAALQLPETLPNEPTAPSPAKREGGSLSLPLPKMSCSRPSTAKRRPPSVVMPQRCCQRPASAGARIIPPKAQEESFRPSSAQPLPKDPPTIVPPRKRRTSVSRGATERPSVLVMGSPAQSREPRTDLSVPRTQHRRNSAVDLDEEHRRKILVERWELLAMSFERRTDQLRGLGARLEEMAAETDPYCDRCTLSRTLGAVLENLDKQKAVTPVVEVGAV
eukprot:RCo007971